MVYGAILISIGVYDFVKRTSFTQFTKERLEEVAKHITTLDRTEASKRMLVPSKYDLKNSL